jgi:hypothetical protein
MTRGSMRFGGNGGDRTSSNLSGMNGGIRVRFAVRVGSDQSVTIANGVTADGKRLEN